MVMKGRSKEFGNYYETERWNDVKRIVRGNREESAKESEEVGKM